MDSDKQTTERLREIFSRAQQVAPGEARNAFIAEACGNDTSLFQEVESLLAAYNTTRNFLSCDASGSLFSDAPDLIGTMINDYRLIEQIGEGGFGEVYRAEQTKPLQREVALKMIKLGMDSKNVVARFEAERQALARMNHPCIAQVYDAGTTQSGRPYFVMELVHGIPILEYCDRHRLHLDDRIKLFQQVCDGVQHAHKKGILHRDLKPSNILVIDESGKPLPKIIDFGVAKSLEGRLTEQALVTLQEMLIGTPMYMSPEQLKHDKDNVDPRSDIYSLGVILYELLAGATPLEHPTPTSLTLAGIQEALNEDELPRPSKRLRALGNKTAVIAGRRQIKPPTLERLLRGDLDWIVMKAIEKERQYRYDDVLSFSEDLECYLNHESVAAGPPRFSRRLRQFIRHHHTPVMATSSIGISLLIGAALATFIIAHRMEPTRNKWAHILARSTPNDTHYVSAESRNPRPPYRSRRTAASSISEALKYASTGDTIEVSDGTYAIKKTIKLGEQSVSLISRNGPERATIDADRNCRIFRIAAHNGPITVKGFTLTGGIHGGSGMWISGSGPVTVEDCRITGNESLGGAGGIAVYTTDPESPVVTIRNCIITNNQSVIDGCGIRIYAPRVIDSDIKIIDCLIADNRTEGSGGGIFCTAARGTISISGCRLENNEAQGFGGAIQQSGDEGHTARVLISRCTILNNRAGRRGGGINATMKKKCTDVYRIEDCIIRDNTAKETGGGIRVYSYDSSVSIARCTITSNSSAAAGGVMLGTKTLITDSLIHANEATAGTGGGIRRGPPGGGTVVNCTITGNRAAEAGGGAHVPKIINSILYGNTAPQHPDLMPDTIVNSSCSPALIETSHGNLCTNPQFADPAAGNFQLLKTSPCIDAGMASSTALDLAGQPRTLDGNGDGEDAVDMGAYEFHPAGK